MNAYRKIEVDEECSKLLTINRRREMFEFSQLAFGMNVAPVVFLKEMDSIHGRLDFEVAYQDDILVKSENPKEHKTNFVEDFRRFQDDGFHLKEEKCEFLYE